MFLIHLLNEAMFESYDENKIEHQEPSRAISAWQEYNDMNCELAILFERDRERYDEWAEPEKKND